MILLGAELEERNKIVLAMINGQILAIDAVCSHKCAIIKQGKLEGYSLSCPWHYAVFDVAVAKYQTGLFGQKNQTSYAVKVD